MNSIWQQYRESPIYQREQGRWGEPNPLYSRMNRYSPIIILGVIVLGICCGGNSISTIFGASETAAGLLALACLPNLLAQILTWAGIFLAPALTAPAIVEERKRGSWEILRLTPYSTTHVLLAKLMGGLSRLKIWLPLLLVNGLQLIIGAYALISLTAIGSPGTAVVTLVILLLFMIRPWAEIGLAALVGLIFSSFSRSARGALVGSYAAIAVFKFFSNSLLWGQLAFTALTNPEFDEIAFGLFAIGPLLIYLGLIFAALIVLRARAISLERGEELVS